MTESKLDLSDLEARVGQWVGGGQLWDPCTAMDIRRWVMAMDYPNPIHWDERFARESRYGGITAPQSFAAALDYGHGSNPACVGRIPGSHLLFGGEEWWFYGHMLRPGDKLFQERRFVDYKVADTKFAGPTVFQRGDTTHRNQNGTLVAKARQTTIRYLVAEAANRKSPEQNTARMPTWTTAALQDVERIRHAWIASNRFGTTPRLRSLEPGHKLPRRVLGPHTIASFSTEYRAFLWNIWGSFHWVAPEGVINPWINQDPGWIEGFGYDEEGATIDPRKRDGLYLGPSRGHVDQAKAEQIGVARSYGYGASMAAWTTDYVSYWAGHDGLVRHTKMSFRSPALEGDVTYLDGEVIDKQLESTWGGPLVLLKITMSNQDGAVIAEGTADVELPAA